VSIAFARKIEDLERRIAALESERAQVEHRRMAGLRAQADAKRAQGEELRAEIRRILAAHQGPRRLTAFAVLTLLKRDPLPSLRRVQEIVRELKSATTDGSSAQATTSTD
jgi:hypothetical protein